MRTAAWGITIALLLLAVDPGKARAQTAQERAQTRRLFRAGMEASRTGDWPAARRAFEEAYALIPNPTILVNLATARRQVGALAEAHAAYQLVLADPGSSTEHRAVATRALAELEAEVPRVRISFENWQAGDVLELDGTPVEDFDAASALKVNEGRHRLSVVRDGGQVATTQFRAFRGAQASVRIVLPAPALQPSSGPGPDLLLGLGVAGLVVAVSLATLVAVSYALDGQCGSSQGDTCTQLYQVNDSAAVLYSVLGAAGLIGGIALLVVGVSQRDESNGAVDSADSEALRFELRLGVGHVVADLSF